MKKRTAVTLDGPVTDQYHDYIYRNVGELKPEVLVDGAPAVFEPHFNENGNTAQNVSHLERGGVVFGGKVESLIAGVPAVHYVISNPGANQTMTSMSAITPSSSHPTSRPGTTTRRPPLSRARVNPSPSSRR